MGGLTHEGIACGKRGNLVAQDFEVRIEVYAVAALDSCVGKALAFALAFTTGGETWWAGFRGGIVLGRGGCGVAALVLTGSGKFMRGRTTPLTYGCTVPWGVQIFNGRRPVVVWHWEDLF